MAKGHNITEEQVQEMDTLREQGFNNKQIAERLGIDPVSVRRHIGSAFRRKPVTEKDIEEMKIYRGLGLSNSQIAIEMGRSRTTIDQYIGLQKESRRADYGSLKTHANGDTFVKQPTYSKEEEMDAMTPEAYLETIKPEKKLKLASSVTTYEGRDIRYKLDHQGNTIQIVSITGENMTLNKDEFLIMLSELNELAGYIS